MILRLDLDAWINSPPSSSSESDEEEDHGTSKEKTFYSSEQNRKPELSPEELQKVIPVHPHHFFISSFTAQRDAKKAIRK